MTNKPKDNTPDFYFWLGSDADDKLESLTEKGFKEKINESKENDRRWREVDVRE